MSSDAYVSERPEALTAEAANSKFKMIQVEPGFKTGEEDTAIAIGLRKDDNRISQINASIETISKDDQVALMDRMIQGTTCLKLQQLRRLAVVSLVKSLKFFLKTGNNSCVVLVSPLFNLYRRNHHRSHYWPCHLVSSVLLLYLRIKPFMAYKN